MRLARKDGTPLDGGGHSTEAKAKAQARAVNASSAQSKPKSRSSKPKKRQSKLKSKDYDPAGEDYSNTLCLWAPVPDNIVDQLNDQLPSDLKVQAPAHVTILFCGEVSDERQAGLVEALDEELAGSGGLQANVTGIGSFAPKPDGDGRVPLVALVNLPGIAELRAEALEAAEEAGIEPPREFGVIPHITIAMVEDVGDISMQPLTSDIWPIDKLELVQGDEVVHTIQLD